MDPTGNIYNINRFPQIPAERREVHDAEAARWSKFSNTSSKLQALELTRKGNYELQHETLLPPTGKGFAAPTSKVVNKRYSRFGLHNFEGLDQFLVFVSALHGKCRCLQFHRRSDNPRRREGTHLLPTNCRLTGAFLYPSAP